MDLENFGRKEWERGNLELAVSLGRKGTRFGVDLMWERERDLREGRQLKAREHEDEDVRASDAILVVCSQFKRFC